MTPIRIALLISLPLLNACSATSPTAPENISTISGGPAFADPAAGTALAASPLRPFGGRCETVVTALPPIAGAPPYIVRLHIEYACQLKHLGRTTAIAEQVLDFSGGPLNVLASNTTTYTAANGDQLFATWSGTSTVIGPAFTFEGAETYAGGTGRFEAASGSSWISGSGSFITSRGRFTSVGTVSY
jgi:hypothetical protein